MTLYTFICPKYQTTRRTRQLSIDSNKDNVSSIEGAHTIHFIAQYIASVTPLEGFHAIYDVRPRAT